MRDARLAPSTSRSSSGPASVLPRPAAYPCGRRWGARKSRALGNEADSQKRAATVICSRRADSHLSARPQLPAEARLCCRRQNRARTNNDERSSRSWAHPRPLLLLADKLATNPLLGPITLRAASRLIIDGPLISPCQPGLIVYGSPLSPPGGPFVVARGWRHIGCTAPTGPTSVLQVRELQFGAGPSVIPGIRCHHDHDAIFHRTAR
jgi:hypothetical protein